MINRADPFLTDDERFDLELLRRATRYQRWVLSDFGDLLSGSVLEVGSGIGNFTRWIARSAEEVTAVEPDPFMCRRIEALGLPNVRVVQARLQDLKAPRSTFNAVVLINVLEHLPNDLAAMRMVAAMLREGGGACLLVPAHPFLYGSLDRRYGHVRRYTTRDVRALLIGSGLRPSRCRYLNPLGAVGWLIVNRVFGSAHLSRTAVVLTESVGVPVGRFLERLGPPPFGQSVVAIGRRR